MADLLTHYVSARLVGFRVRDRAVATLFAAGVLFPDMLGKPLAFFPGAPHLLEIPSHTPFGLIFACGAVSQLFARGFRGTAFWALYLGSLLHVVGDLMKDYLGSGAVFLLHPFSLDTFEVGLYRSEDVFYFLPVNLVVLGLFWLVRKRRSPSPPGIGVTVP